jgi:hypothetical protein
MNMMNQGEKVHNVPVPERFLPLVHRVLAEAYAADSTVGSSRVDAPQEAPPDDDGLSYEWTEEEVARAYRESSPTMQVILDYLADHAEDWVPAPELARVAYPQESNGVEDRLYGAFGGMGRRFHNQYRKHWFFDYGRERNPDGSWGSMRYRMPPERAAWVKRASGSE